MTKNEAFELLRIYINNGEYLIFKASGLPNEINDMNSRFVDNLKYTNVIDFSKLYIGDKLPFSIVEIDNIETLKIALETWSSSIPELREIIVFNKKVEVDSLVTQCSEDYLYLSFKSQIKIVVKNTNKDNSHDVYETEIPSHL